MLRCDLQVHSSFSDRPSEWVLRKLGMPESYTRPIDLYRKLRERGCDLITITDHNRIDGCLEIADLPGTFISTEVTTYFPEDGCKIHLLVWNITEAQYARIEELRENIYDLSAYLRSEHMIHGVAHPLYNINGRLTVEHFEKLILLFRVFEEFNGARNPLAQEISTFCLKLLTPEKINELANRHNFEPTHSEAWRKSFTGGSDDHGGLYLGETWTEVSNAKDAKSFLEQVYRGLGKPGGHTGSALRFSTSMYNVIISYAVARLGETTPYGMKFLSKVAERFLAGKNPAHIPFTDKISHLMDAIKTGHALDFVKPRDPSVNKQLAKYFLDPRIKTELDKIIAKEPTPERRTFRMASKIVNDLSYRLFLDFLEKIHHRNFFDSLQPLSALLPIGASVAPYVVSFKTIHGDRPFLAQTAKRFGNGRLPESLGRTKCAWFTDTLEDVNGVARTIRAMTHNAQKTGADITVITSRSQVEIDDIPIMNFLPVGEFEIPEYELQKLSFPPILEMIDYIQREKFTQCIISTPGPVGLTALFAAKLLGLRTSGIYHTDFPQYVRILTDDNVLETMMWSFMRWFYSQLDRIYVNSNYYRRRWIERGIAAEKLEILPRGLDTELFNPQHQNADFWPSRGAKEKVLLYVGRISKEKELEFLAEVYKNLRKRGAPVSLALVGDGPYKKELEKKIPDAVFTGILTGLELGMAYASADLFVFPSTTDTFGNVVIEALASGLPVLVSDVGGPKELIEHEHEGRVLPARDLKAWTETIEELLKNPIKKQESLLRVEIIQGKRSWGRAFEEFWKLEQGE